MLESPPVSPKTVRHGKRSRQSSMGEISAGNLSQEDVGYDGDIEVIRPDEVEEPETESDDDDSTSDLRRLLWPDADEELAAKMKRLGWRTKDEDDRGSKYLEKPGTKRLSKETDPSHLNQHGKRSDFEISEMAEASHRTPLAKRRKDANVTVANKLMKDRHEMQTDPSEHTEGRDDNPFPLCGNSASSAAEADGDEEMDLD